METPKSITYLVEMTAEDYSEILKLIQRVQKNREINRDMMKQKKGIQTVREKARLTLPTMKVIQINN